MNGIIAANGLAVSAGASKGRQAHFGDNQRTGPCIIRTPSCYRGGPAPVCARRAAPVTWIEGQTIHKDKDLSPSQPTRGAQTSCQQTKGPQAPVMAMPDGHRLLQLDEVGSTNAEALRLAETGECGPLWIMARRQTAGRGRLGRRWMSSADNLQATLLFASACSQAKAHEISFVAALAVHSTTVELANRSGSGVCAPPGLRLKWPNDGLIGAAKYCGILCESLPLAASATAARSRGRLLCIAAGIGINLGQAPAIDDRPVTSLKDHGINARPVDAVAVLATEFARWLAIWRDGNGFSDIRDAWVARSVPPGTLISIKTGATGAAADRSSTAQVARQSSQKQHVAGPGRGELEAGDVTGRFAGIDETGALLIDVEGRGLRRFTYGDVSLP